MVLLLLCTSFALPSVAVFLPLFCVVRGAPSSPHTVSYYDRIYAACLFVVRLSQPPCPCPSVRPSRSVLCLPSLRSLTPRPPPRPPPPPPPVFRTYVRLVLSWSTATETEIFFAWMQRATPTAQALPHGIQGGQGFYTMSSTVRGAWHGMACGGGRAYPPASLAYIVALETNCAN